MKKSLISSRLAVATLAGLAVITLSSCNNKKADESVSSNSQSSPSTSATAASPADSPATAASPSTSPASASQTQGVAPQGTACPSGNPIKGVDSKKLGGKVALTTKSPVYSTTKATKCFPDTATAEQAGYKASK